MNVIKSRILWIAAFVAFFMHASAHAFPSVNRIWEISSYRYNAASLEAIIGYDSSVRPTSAYDEAQKHSTVDENRALDGASPLFDQSGEFKAAEGGLTAAERREIEQIADKYDTTIDVVGSRARGEGNNILTDLPVGHDPVLERSDIVFA